MTRSVLVSLDLAAVASACESFLRVWRDEKAEPAAFGAPVRALTAALTPWTPLGFEEQLQTEIEKHRTMRILRQRNVGRGVKTLSRCLGCGFQTDDEEARSRHMSRMIVRWVLANT